jgi:hypothetical protein
MTSPSPVRPTDRSPSPWRRLSVRTGVAGIGTVAVVAAVTGIALASFASAATGPPSAWLPAPSTAAGMSNPPTSMRPTPAFTTNCLKGPGHSAACNRAALSEINLAHEEEGIPALTLPASFSTSTDQVQLRMVTNQERSDRKIPVMALNATLSASAQKGANNGTDPLGPPNTTWGSNIAQGYETPLAADFGWMYDDGPGSPNTACSTPTAKACWGHRENILVTWGGAQGAGAYYNARLNAEQLTQLFVKNY